MPGPVYTQVSGHAEVSASDCHYPWLSASSGTQRARDLLIRSHPYGCPDSFRSVRDLGRIPARCSRESGELEGRSSAWFPAAPRAWHLGALVLITTNGPSSGALAPVCPAQTPPPNPAAAKPGDGRVLSRLALRVHEPCTFTEVVALRSQPGLTGSGSHGPSYGGFGGGHPHFHPHTGRRWPDLITWPCQLGNRTDYGGQPLTSQLRWSVVAVIDRWLRPSRVASLLPILAGHAGAVQGSVLLDGGWLIDPGGVRRGRWCFRSRGRRRSSLSRGRGWREPGGGHECHYDRYDHHAA